MHLVRILVEKEMSVCVIESNEFVLSIEINV